MLLYAYSCIHSSCIAFWFHNIGSLVMPVQIKFVELEEGQELTGTINRLLLIHGVQVDIGAEFDA